MIACLGWGSLIWCPGCLPIDQWKSDGPYVKVEFVRQSQCNRLTLVLYNDAEPVRSLWARMTAPLNEAVCKLTRREYSGIAEENIDDWSETNIGRWSKGMADPKVIPGLGSWASQQDDIDYVIWTALGPKFCGRPVAPTEEQVVAYLRRLSNEGRACKAEEYVRKAPSQIRTAYRRRIEHCLGWMPLNY